MKTRLLAAASLVAIVVFGCSSTTEPGGGGDGGSSTDDGGSSNSDGGSSSNSDGGTSSSFACSGSATCNLVTTAGPQGSTKLIFDAPGGKCQFAEPTDRKTLVFSGKNLTLDGKIVGNFTASSTGFPTTLGYDIGGGAVQLSGCKP